MSTLLKMKDKYIYRHKMLEYLYNKVKDEPLHEVKLQKSVTAFKKMAEDLSIDPIKLREYHQGFHGFKDNEDHVKCDSVGNVFVIGLQEAGLRAYLDDYWLREGEKELNERLYDRIKWRIPLISASVALLSLVFTIGTTIGSCNKVNRLEQELNQLKKVTKPVAQLSESFYPCHIK